MRIAKVAAWALLASLVLLIGAGGVLYGQGYRVYAVRTGSMTPTYPTGSLVVDRPVDPGARLQVGRVVTFRTHEGLVTHRVAARVTGGLQTKGDANRSVDPWTLPPQNVVGEVVGGVTRGGYVLVFLHQPTGVPSLVLLVISVTLAWHVFFGATSDQEPRRGHRRRRRRPPLAVPTAIGTGLLLLVAGATGVADLGAHSTGAYFSDATVGSLTLDVGCEDTHDHGQGPDNGNGHQKCRGKGHTKDSADPALP